MSEEDKGTLKWEKNMKVLFIIYADTESSLGMIGSCHSNHGNPSTAKINKHTACGYSLFTHRSFHTTKNTTITEMKTVWKTFVKTEKNIQQNQSAIKKENNTINEWRE